MAVAIAPVPRTTIPVLLTREFPGRAAMSEFARSAGGWLAVDEQVSSKKTDTRIIHTAGNTARSAIISEALSIIISEVEWTRTYDRTRGKLERAGTTLGRASRTKTINK
jgi:hypothetical protein